MSAQHEAVTRIREWRENPVKFVYDVFNVEPDLWQKDALESISAAELVARRRLAMKAATGVGKSGVLAWIGWHRLVCFADKGEHPKGAALSGEGWDNLQDNLWAELAKWQSRSEFLSRAFIWNRERIYAKDHAETWFLSARSYPMSADAEAVGRSLSGLHSRFPFILLDETGDMPVTVGQKAEQIFTGGVSDALVAQAGNPTSNTGLLYHVCVNERERWEVITITADPDDPKRSPRVDIEHAREQIKVFGKDNPWVKATILGEFPDVGINTLLSVDEVERAMARGLRLEDYDNAQKRIGVDCARFGCFDDQTEVLTDHGWKFFDDLTGQERVVSVPLNGLACEYKPILKVHRYDFDGYLNLHEGRSVNYCVTDNHKFPMLRRSINNQSHLYALTEHKDLPVNFALKDSVGWSGSSPKFIQFKWRREMPNGGLHERVTKFNMIDWASLLGWILSEGNIYIEKRKQARYRICISQVKEHTKLSIAMLLDRMGIKWRLTAKNRQFEFTNRTIAEHIISHCGRGSSNLKVPKYIKDGSEDVINEFLDAFRAGDGTKKKNGKGRTYFTSSKMLADDIHEMLSKVGRAGKLTKKEVKGTSFLIEGRTVTRKNDTFVVYERHPDSKEDKWCTKAKVKKHRYTGMVYCVSTEYKTILVRRGGTVYWSGNSDFTSIFPRQGLRAFKPVIMSGARSNEIAARVALAKSKWGSEMEFVDGTGGYGSGVIDSLIQAGHSPLEVNFAGKADDSRYFNKRSEMWFRMSEWVKRGGSLPKEPRLLKELTAPTYSFQGGKFRLEEKDQIKKRLGFSPDLADSLALTFTLVDMPRSAAEIAGIKPSRQETKHEWDPFR